MEPETAVNAQQEICKSTDNNNVDDVKYLPPLFNQNMFKALT
jgi:hypothetical protein